MCTIWKLCFQIHNKKVQPINTLLFSFVHSKFLLFSILFWTHMLSIWPKLLSILLRHFSLRILLFIERNFNSAFIYLRMHFITITHDSITIASKYVEIKGFWNRDLFIPPWLSIVPVLSQCNLFLCLIGAYLTFRNIRFNWTKLFVISRIH